MAILWMTFYEIISVDEFVKSRNSIEYVIPAKAGIQLLQGVLDPGFRRGDDQKVKNTLSPLMGEGLPCGESFNTPQGKGGG